MTQPDLVSKLREMIAKGKVGWMDSTDFSHELGYALGGNKVYPDAEDCTKAHPCIAIPDAVYPCTAKRVIVFDADELESLLGREGQAARTFDEWWLSEGINHMPRGDQPPEHAAIARLAWNASQSCGPSQPETEGEAGRQPVVASSPSVQVFMDEFRATLEQESDQVRKDARLWAVLIGLERSTQPSPSTPIVPSTPDDPRFDGVVEELVEEFAILDGDIPRLRGILGRLQPAAGLSAEQVREIVEVTKDLEHFAGQVTTVTPPLAVHLEAIQIAMEHAADRLNALLAAKPAEGDAFSTSRAMKEAQIRKDALEEAAQMVDEDYRAEYIAEAIRALAERPAPAGEVRSGWEQGYDRAIREALEAGLPQLEWANIHGSRCEELLRWVKDLLRLSPAGEAKGASK